MNKEKALKKIEELKEYVEGLKGKDTKGFWYQINYEGDAIEGTRDSLCPKESLKLLGTEVGKYNSRFIKVYQDPTDGWIYIYSKSKISKIVDLDK